VLLVAFFLSSIALWGGLAADDHFLRMVIQDFPGIDELATGNTFSTFIFADGTDERNTAFINRGLIPWWSTPMVRLAFWRPLASLTHYVDFHLFGDTSWPMHLQNILWYLALALALAGLYKRMLGPQWVALLATLLYAVDDAHGLAIGWIANRNALMATVFAVLVIRMHDLARRDGLWKAAPAAWVLFGIGLLCGEATLSVCGYLFAHALFLDKAGWKRGIISLMPYGAIIIPWRLAYQVMGFGATGSGMYLDPVREPVLFFEAVITRLPMLLNAQLAYPPAAAWVWASEFWKTILPLIAMAILLFVIWVLMPLLRRSPVARFWLLGMTVATLPVCATFPLDRLLFFAGIGGMGLVAQFIGGLTEEEKWVPENSSWRRRARALVFAWVVIHLVVSPLSFPIRVRTMPALGRALEAELRTLPSAPAVADQNLILVSAQSDFHAWHVPIMRSSMNQVVPRTTRALSVGPYDTTYRRIDESTLEVTPSRGFVLYPWGRMFRGWSYEFRVGDTLEFSGMATEVLSLTEDNRPAGVAFTFAKPLEDPSLLFYEYTPEGYRLFDLPEVGETITVPGFYATNWFRHFLPGQSPSE
jgi:hypothetical protein